MTTSASRPKVLQLAPIAFAHTTWAAIEAVADVVVPKATNRAAFIEECASGAFDGVDVVYRNFGSLELTGRVDNELLFALPRSLKYVCHNGAGYDSVDVMACTVRGIRVSNTPTAVDEATADIHIFLMLGAMRNLGPALSAIRAGHWRGEHGAPPLGRDPEGKTLGVLGMGGIGRAVARKARGAFDMNIIYHNRRQLAPAVEDALGGAVYKPTLDALLAEADVLSINVPLNAHTRHLIGADQFAQMKDGVVVVNTARGAVVDEQALVDALASGKVAAAGLDVYEFEPAVHPELLASDKVLLAPHMGTSTVETETKMETWALENVLQALTEGTLKSIVPEQAGMAF